MTVVENACEFPQFLTPVALLCPRTQSRPPWLSCVCCLCVRSSTTRPFPSFLTSSFFLTTYFVESIEFGFVRCVVMTRLVFISLGLYPMSVFVLSVTLHMLACTGRSVRMETDLEGEI